MDDLTQQDQDDFLNSPEGGGPSLIPVQSTPDMIAVPDGPAMETQRAKPEVKSVPPEQRRDPEVLQENIRPQEQSRLKDIRKAIAQHIPGIKRKATEQDVSVVQEQKQEPTGSIRRPSDKRFVKQLEVFTKLLFNPQKPEGLENYDKIPKGADVIFLMSHIQSDAEDPMILAELGRAWDLAVADHSTHHNRKNPVARLGNLLVGDDHFYPINQTKAGDNSATPFRRDNYTNLVKAFDKRKAVAIAVNSPVYDGKLPDRPGYGAVLLAELAAAEGKNPVLVPVAVNFDTERTVAKGGNAIGTIVDLVRNGRPKATVRVGEPYTLPKMDVSPFFERTDLQKVTQTNNSLRELGGINMRAMAKLYPTDRQGIWGQGQKPTVSEAPKPVAV